MPGAIYPQTTGVLFLNQAITSALRNNPDIQQERGRLQRTNLEIFADVNVLNPFFLFDADLAQRTYSFGLQKAFETGGLGKIRRKIREKRVELQRAELNERIIELEDQVIDTFTQVYINQERIKLLEETFSFIKAKQQEAQNLSEIEELLAEEEIIDIIQRLEDSKIEVDKARLLLEELLGRKVTGETPLESPKELKIKGDMTEEELIEMALKEKPEIIENNKELELAELLKKLARANYWPLVIADGGVRINFQESQAGIFIGLDIELPVLGIERKQIEAAEQRIELIKENRKILEKKIKLEVSETYKLYEFTKKRLEDYDREYLPRTKQLISSIREKYENNEISFSDLLKAEKSKIKIQNNYFDALFDFENAFSDLERAVGITLAEGLPEPGVSEFQGIVEPIR